MTAEVLANNLWVLICGLLVFTMTIAVGLLEVGELGVIPKDLFDSRQE